MASLFRTTNDSPVHAWRKQSRSETFRARCEAVHIASSHFELVKWRKLFAASSPTEVSDEAPDHFCIRGIARFAAATTMLRSHTPATSRAAGSSDAMSVQQLH